MVGSEWQSSTWRGASSHQGRVINVLPEQLAAVVEALCVHRATAVSSRLAVVQVQGKPGMV